MMAECLLRRSGTVQDATEHFAETKADAADDSMVVGRTENTVTDAVDRVNSAVAAADKVALEPENAMHSDLILAAAESLPSDAVAALGIAAVADAPAFAGCNMVDFALRDSVHNPVDCTF